MSTDLGVARGRIVIDAAGVGRGLASAGGAIDLFSKKAIGLGAGLTAGYGIIQGIRSTISVAAGFEQRLSALRAVSGATGTEMAKLTAQAIRLGKSTTFTTSEVAQAQTELVKAGASVKDVLGGALDSALALAAAGEVDLPTAAKTVANAMNQFGLAAGEAGRVADILASVANTTATDVGELALAFAQGGSAAKQAGLPIQDFAGMLGALAEQGIVGSDAGTSLKAALLSLIAPMGQGAKAIEQYGLEFFKANGQIKSAAGIAEELRSKLGRLNPQQRTAVLQAIAGRDGFRALAAAYDLGSAALTRNIAASQRSGQAAETARTKQDNLRGDVEKLGGAIEALQIKAGGAVQGSLRALTQGATGLIDAAANSRGLADFGQGLLDVGAGAASAITSLAPLANAALQLAGAAAGAVSATASLGAAFLGTEAGAVTLQAALIGLVTAYGVYKGAAITAAAATRVVSAAQTAGAFVSLATSVRSAGSAFALLGAAAPALANPLVLTAAAVAGVAAGVAVLSSGILSAPGPMAQLAAQLDSLTAASGRAAAALGGVPRAIDRLKDANLQAKVAANQVQLAEENLARVRSSGASQAQITQAELAVEQARRQSSKASRDQAQAEAAVGRQIKGTAQQLLALATGHQSAAEKGKLQADLLRQLGPLTRNNKAVTADLTRMLAGLGQEGLTNAQRFQRLQQFAGAALKNLKGNSPAVRELRSDLQKLRDADPKDLPKVVAGISSGMSKGKAKAKGGVDAIKKDVKSLDRVTVNLSSLKGSIEAGLAATLASTRAKVAQIRAELNSVGSAPSASGGGPAGGKKKTTGAGAHEMGFRSHGAGAIQESLDIDSIVARRETLDARLAKIDKDEQDRQRRRERDRLQDDVSNAQKKLAAARTSQARSEARSALNDAKAALAEFRVQVSVEAKRAGIAMKTGFMDKVSSRFSDIQSGLQDIGQRAGEAIQRGLDRSLDGLKETLKAKLAEIDNSAGAQRAGALGDEITRARDAQSARQADRQRADLTKAAGAAGDVVARRQDALARARTESERQAAQKLLDQALAEQASAAGALADFEEEQRIAQMEREKASLEAGLQARRDAAQREHDDAVAAAEREAARRQAELERALGDLEESFRRREISAKQFNARLAAILGDPKLAAELDLSGQELGLSFSRGLLRSRKVVEDAAATIARIPAKYLKINSPAETGPLAYSQELSGRILVRDLAAGMVREESAIRRASAGIASAAALRFALGAPGMPAAGGSGGFVQNVELNVDGPTLNPREIAALLGWEAQFGRGRR